jgi:hypothetical protein
VNNQGWLRDKLFDLASEVQEGCIVELGAFHGAGTIRLARGARAGYGAQVYTIDDYTAIGNWFGKLYKKGGKEIFRKNIREANVEVQLISKTFDAAVLSWHEPIGLLYWDPGARNRFWSDWLNWYKHIVVGGVAVLKDAGHGDLGATKSVGTICSAGLFVEEEHVGGVTILRRV